MPQFSLPPCNLFDDELLKPAPRMSFCHVTVPAIGRIPLLARIGQGELGTVYLGYKALEQLEVAVKVMPLSLAADQPYMALQLVREARLAAKLESPHLVRIYDVGEEDELFYLVMEYVHGATAGRAIAERKRARQAPMDEPSALDICIAAAEGLAVAHAAGIVHRDIKPDNILIPRERNAEGRRGKLLFTQAKLADLSLAHDGVGGALFGSRVVGTPGFMAPELWQSAAKAGKSADVFSLGATLYALLTGRVPYDGNLIAAILAGVPAKHLSLDQIVGEVSPATVKLADACLDREPERRFADAAELIEALKHARKGERAAPPEASHLKPVSPEERAMNRASMAPGAARQAVAVAKPAVPNTVQVTLPDARHQAIPLGGWVVGGKEKTTECFAAKGSWFMFDLRHEHTRVYHVIQWNGQPEVHLLLKANVLLMAPRSNGPWAVAGLDARGPDGVDILKRAKSGRRLASLIVRDLTDPALVDAAETVQPTALRIEGNATAFGLKRFAKLRFLSLVGKDTVALLPGLKALKELRGLHLEGCRNLKHVRDLGELTGLGVLRLGSCTELADLEGLQELKHLERLDVLFCSTLREVRVLGRLKSLTQVNLNASPQVRDLMGMEELSALRGLDVSFCPGLQDIAAVAKLKGLVYLNFRGCEQLVDLHHLHSLKKLVALGLPPKTTERSLMDLRDAGVLDNIGTLNLSGCADMRRLAPLVGLRSLKHLYLAGCKSMLPEVIENMRLSLPECTIETSDPNLAAQRAALLSTRVGQTSVPAG